MFSILSRKALAACLFSALLSTVSEPVFARQAARADSNTIAMVTGPRTGTYIAMGRDIAEIAKKHGERIEVNESKGSIDNIKRITSGEKVSLGIVQSDVLGFLSRSKNPESIRIAKKLRMIFPLHNEEIHVLARNDIKRFADLNNKRVIVGTEGSGNMVTSVNLFSLLGINPAKMFKVDPTQGIVAVLNNQADAIIFVGGKPVRMFKNMEELATIKEGPDAGKLNQVHFLPLDDPRLLKEYATSSITSADYAFVTEPVPTIAVTAILMGYDFSPKDNKYRRSQCENITKLARSIRSDIDWLVSKGHPKWKEVNLDVDVAFWQKDACAWSQAALKPMSKEHSLEKDLIGIIRTQAAAEAQPAHAPAASASAPVQPPSAPSAPVLPTPPIAPTPEKTVPAAR